MSKRRQYSPEFKRGAVEQTRQPGVNLPKALSNYSRPNFVQVLDLKLPSA